MQTKVHFFVDVSNFARLKGNTASLNRFLSAVTALRSALEDRDHEIVMIADSGLWRWFNKDDAKNFDKLIERHEVIVADSGVEADIPLLELARKHNGHIVTGDGFRDHQRFRDWLDVPSKARLIGGVRDPLDGTWLFTERLMQKQTFGVRARNLTQVLDDIYPTPRSVARQANLDVVVLQEFVTLVPFLENQSKILVSTEVETLRELINQIQKYPIPLALVAEEASLNEAELDVYIKLLKIKTGKVGEVRLVDEKTKAKLLEAVSFSKGDVGLFRILTLGRNRDFSAIKKLSQTSNDELSVLARSVLDVWLSVADADGVFDVERLNILPTDVALEVLECVLHLPGLSLQNEVSSSLVRSANPDLRLSLLISQFLTTPSRQLLSKIVDVLEEYAKYFGLSTVDSSHSSHIADLFSYLSNVDLVAQLKIPSSQLTKIANRFVALSPNSGVTYVMRFLIDDVGTSFDLSIAERYRSEFIRRLVARLGAEWLSDSAVMRWKPSIEEVALMSSGDFSPLFSSATVSKLTLSKIDEVVQSESKFALVALISATHFFVTDVESSLKKSFTKLGNI